MQTSVMLSSTLSIASANSSDVIPEETWTYVLLFHHIFGLRDVLTMYIFFKENNAEPNTSSANEEAHKVQLVSCSLFYMTFYQLFDFVQHSKNKKVLVHIIILNK